MVLIPAGDFEIGSNDKNAQADEKLVHTVYLWHGKGTVVISHGFVKKTAAVPEREIQRALDRKRLFEQNPDLHTQETHNAG